MQAGPSAARPARARHRHELRTLTYVTLDEGKGGVIRNLSHEGVAVQAMTAVRPGQQLRVRFDLADPRVRVDAQGEVMWAKAAGECGVRFLDLSPNLVQGIDEWIFGDLLESVALHSRQDEPMFALATTPPVADAVEDDGLIVSPAAVKVIELPTPSKPPTPIRVDKEAEETPHALAELDWLSQPLSRRSIVWVVNTLTLVAAVLLFALIFLSVNGEAPKWPVAMTAGVVAVVAALYWVFFKLFGGASPGVRLARLAGYEPSEEDDSGGARFR
jgi:hypothetical protein